jgi:hypothetical protein
MSDAPVKVVVDCSQSGAPDKDVADALAGNLREAALDAIANGDLEKAAAFMQNATDALAASDVTPGQVFELNDEEIAQHEADQAEFAERADAVVQQQFGELLARCDRYLAETDWIMLPAAARPVDMSANLAQTCDANQKAWAAWRAQVKQLRDAAAAGTANLDDPGFPDQPAAPAVVLT